MNEYFPAIRPAAYTIEALTARRNFLAKLGASGTITEKKSMHRKAELAAIDTNLKARGIKAAQVRIPRKRPQPDSGPADTARARVEWPPVVVARANMSTAYSSAVQAVSSDYQPRRNSIYG